MKKYVVLASVILLTVSGISQTINQLGYYYRNGLIEMDVKSNYMILSNGEIVDNSIPSSPSLTAQFSFNGDGITVLVDGDYSYFGTGMTNDLYVADISNITFPIQTAHIDFNIGHGVFGMAVKNDILLAALGSTGNNGTICSIDLTDKNHPIPLDTVYIPGGQCRDIVIHDDYAFAAHYGGLKVIDISDMSDLQIVTSVGSGYNSVVAGDGLVFMGKSSGGIDAFSIADPLNPAPAFAIPNAGGTAWDLKYEADHIYLATNSQGLYIYKIMDNEGIEMANFPNNGNGQSFGVSLQDSLVLLSGLINGVAILHYDSTGTVHINSDLDQDHLKISPNPFTTSTSLSYELQQPENVSLSIFNHRGQIVFQTQENQQQGIQQLNWNAEFYPVGIYYYRLNIGDAAVNGKMVKVR